VHDLIALALGASGDSARFAGERGGRAARLSALQSDLRAQVENPELDVGWLARRHRITPRYVHKLLETTGSTFSQLVLGERLERALRKLRDPRYAQASISAIAFSVGFGDLSYFNRTFRRRFGATPSELRRSNG